VKLSENDYLQRTRKKKLELLKGYS
jgi:hypothetical protein